jgi:cytochrome c5
MKRISKLIAALAVVAFAASAALAAEGGNSRHGKYLYKKSCRTCHSPGDAGGDLTPQSKTQAQWDRFFKENKHRAKPAIWKNYSPKELKDINQFLYDHAIDSDQPETCG